jgi:hypothetical protein|tara:strand:+ start:200 stop:319 length:120 start_codon:yes stop_codon:yes gene_type:complete
MNPPEIVAIKNWFALHQKKRTLANKAIKRHSAQKSFSCK